MDDVATARCAVARAFLSGLLPSDAVSQAVPEFQYGLGNAALIDPGEDPGAPRWQHLRPRRRLPWWMTERDRQALCPQQEHTVMTPRQRMVSSRSTRSFPAPRRWLAVAGAAVMAVGVLVGGAIHAQARDVGIRQTAAIGGYAEFLRDFPGAGGAAAAARATGGAWTVPLGGYAELLRDQQSTAATNGTVVQTTSIPARPMGGQAEAILLGSPAA
jgi:hypothetical protein